MLCKEFEKGTGYIVSEEEFQQIEQLWYSFKSNDKQEFFNYFKTELQKDFSENRRLQIDCLKKELELQKEHYEKALLECNHQLTFLKKQNEKLLNWKKFESSNTTHMTQEDYLELAMSCNQDNFLINLEQALDWICEEFGFAKEKIYLLEMTLVPIAWEKNVRYQIRMVEEAERSFYFFSSDWNYFWFEVCGITYEVVNGQLYPNMYTKNN